MFTTYIISLNLITNISLAFCKYSIRLLFMNYTINEFGKNSLNLCLFWVYLRFVVNLCVNPWMQLTEILRDLFSTVRILFTQFFLIDRLTFSGKFLKHILILNTRRTLITLNKYNKRTKTGSYCGLNSLLCNVMYFKTSVFSCWFFYIV
jgi:hypothetical protein